MTYLIPKTGEEITMDIYRDPLGKLDRDKAVVFRERQEEQLEFLRDKLIKLKNHRDIKM